VFHHGELEGHAVADTAAAAATAATDHYISVAISIAIGRTDIAVTIAAAGSRGGSVQRALNQHLRRRRGGRVRNVRGERLRISVKNRVTTTGVKIGAEINIRIYFALKILIKILLMLTQSRFCRDRKN
jgi:hypothetical protein